MGEIGIGAAAAVTMDSAKVEADVDGEQADDGTACAQEAHSMVMIERCW